MEGQLPFPIEVDDEEEEEEDDEEEEEEEEEEDEPVVDLPRALRDGASDVPDSGVCDGDDGVKRRRTGGGGEEVASSSQGSEWNRGEIEGLFCPICMDAWTSEGNHHICCLPCGHLYGMSCIKKWLQQNRNSAKCPQCNKKCSLKDVRKLFAPKIVVIDEESQKRIRFLESKCDSLEKKGNSWRKKEAGWLKKKVELHKQIQQLTERTTYLERSLAEKERSRQYDLGAAAATGVSHAQAGSRCSPVPNFGGHRPSCNFVLQKELHVDGARLIDVDIGSQIVLIARKLSGIGGTVVLSKMSLIFPHEIEDIILPPNTKLVKDLHISPFDRSLALFSTVGKKLSVMSMESNNTVLNYDLPVPAWSCSWDLSSSHYIFAGLQNGDLQVFDIRQTVKPVESLKGLTVSPIHTVHSRCQTPLTASSMGLCQWNLGADERPCLVPGTENQGSCISLAYCPSNDNIVASYCPNLESDCEIPFTQQSVSPVPGQGVQGWHVHFKRVQNSSSYQKISSTFARVKEIQMPNSVIVETGDEHGLFVSGDEGACELIVQELPSLTVNQRLKLQRQPFHDVKYTHALGQGLLGCLSGDSLHIFSPKLS